MTPRACSGIRPLTWLVIGVVDAAAWYGLVWFALHWRPGW